MASSISLDVLNTLPAGKVMSVTTTTDQYGVVHEAIMYSFHDEWGGRVAYFDLHTGDYLGEA